MTKDETLKLALYALEELKDWQVSTPVTHKAIAALREALSEQPAQQEHKDWCASLTQMLTSMPPKPAPCNCKQPAQQQEPVAWRYNGKLHEFDPSDWATSPVTPLYTSPPSKPWVNPSIKEYEDIMLANIMPRTNDERDGIMSALNDMVVLLQEKNT